MSSNSSDLADQERSVAAIYESSAIAGAYLDKRMRFSWQRHLHDRQVQILNGAIRRYRPQRVLEVAPGPARLTVELKGVTNGTLVENSEEMINIARERLRRIGGDKVWQVLQGNAFELTRHVPADGFDFAYTFRFLRHFRSPEREQLYDMLRQTLKPNGVLIFDVVSEVVHQRVHAKNPVRNAEEIAIYDVTYTPQTFRDEMGKAGFDVIELTPILRHFGAQSFLSYKLDDVFPKLIPPVIRTLEWVPSSAPLEWVAVCRKR